MLNYSLQGHWLRPPILHELKELILLLRNSLRDDIPLAYPIEKDTDRGNLKWIRCNNRKLVMTGRSKQDPPKWGETGESYTAHD